MSFLLAIGAEKLATAMSDKRQQRRHQRQKQGDWEPPVLDTHWEQVLHGLKHNEASELRLGWHDASSGLVPSQRALSALAKALRANTSLRRISIGWHWQKQRQPQRRELLLQLLTTLAECLRPQQLQSVQLVLNDCLPSNVLSKLMQSQTALSCIDLQVVTMQHVSPWKGIGAVDATAQTAYLSSLRSENNSARSNTGRSVSKSRKKKVAAANDNRQLARSGSGESVGSSGSNTTSKNRGKTHVVPLLVACLEAQNYTALSELRLVDCDLDNAAAELLAQGLPPTSFLSVRGNRRLTGHGAAALLSSRALQQPSSSLDLSLCDLWEPDFERMERALDQRSCPLHQLLLCGNYRMELAGLIALMRVAPGKVGALDLSFCDLSEAMTVHILRTLIHLGQGEQQRRSGSATTATCRLHELTLHGCRIASRDATAALLELLQLQDLPLRALHVNDDKADRKYLSAAILQQIAHALQTNYQLEHLTVDYFKNVTEQAAWRDIEYWLRLNRAGRRVLLPQVSGSAARPEARDDHSVVVAKALQEDMTQWLRLVDMVKAEPGLEALYWVVRNSAGRFGQK